MNKSAKKKVGRPAKYAAKRVTLTTRLQEDLYEKLKSEAESKGLSISEEIEGRLTRSLRDQPVSLVMAIMRHMMNGARKFEAPPGWILTFRREAKAQIKQKLAEFVDSLPESESTEPYEPLPPEEIARLREMLNKDRAEGPHPSIRKRR